MQCAGQTIKAHTVLVRKLNRRAHWDTLGIDINDNIKMYLTDVGWIDVDHNRDKCWVGFCENGNESSSSTKCRKLLEWLSL